MEELKNIEKSFNEFKEQVDEFIKKMKKGASAWQEEKINKKITEDINETTSFEQMGYDIGKITMEIAKGFEKAINELRKEKE